MMIASRAQVKFPEYLRENGNNIQNQQGPVNDLDSLFDVAKQINVTLDVANELNVTNEA
eukprot:m.133645 g.133645  ORF g.133645 m.133645 type:complete len:59 (-) comp16893_c1_seq3:3228-3404(-)